MEQSLQQVVQFASIVQQVLFLTPLNQDASHVNLEPGQIVAITIVQHVKTVMFQARVHQAAQSVTGAPNRMDKNQHVRRAWLVLTLQMESSVFHAQVEHILDRAVRTVIIVKLVPFQTPLNQDVVHANPDPGL